MKRRKKIKMVILFFVTFYIVYLAISIFEFPKWRMNNIACQKQNNTFDTSFIRTTDQAVVISEVNDALSTRCNLIDYAKEYLYISQYSIADDDSGTIFMGKLLDAANRGVKVKLLVNNLSTKMSNYNHVPLDIFQQHPNIEIKGIGGINLVQPWKMNNVLHDKLIIVDNDYFLSSGRNIEDRFLLPKNASETTFDRDILVKRGNVTSESKNIKQVTTYYNELWKNSDTKKKTSVVNVFKNHNKMEKEFSTHYLSTLKKRQHIIESVDLKSLDFVPFDGMKLLSNEVGPTVKKPMVLEGIAAYFRQAKENITIQTPYVIITNDMQEIINEYNIRATVITNSENASPNLLAMSGYVHNKKELEDKFSIYEYGGEGSLHQKAILIDKDISMIGSFNFDPRSTFLSSENYIVIKGAAINTQLQRSIDKNKSASQNSLLYVKPNSHIKNSLIKLLSYLSPLYNFLL